MWKMALRRCCECGRLHNIKKMLRVSNNYYCGLLCYTDKISPRFRLEAWGPTTKVIDNIVVPTIGLIREMDRATISRTLEILGQESEPASIDFVKIFRQRHDGATSFIPHIAFLTKYLEKEAVL